jgi:hypothetical protein
MTKPSLPFFAVRTCFASPADGAHIARQYIGQGVGALLIALGTKDDFPSDGHPQNATSQEKPWRLTSEILQAAYALPRALESIELFAGDSEIVGLIIGRFYEP